MKKELLAALLCGGGLAVMTGASLLPSEDSGKVMTGKMKQELTLDHRADNLVNPEMDIPRKVGASGSTI